MSDFFSYLLQKTILQLLDNLKFLQERWIIDCVDSNSMRLVHVNSSKNAAVDNCIFFDSKSDFVGVFIHGMPVPRHSRLFQGLVNPEEGNVGSLSDFLIALVNNIEQFHVCEGITQHSELWDISRGLLDYNSSSKSPSYHSESCEVLIHKQRKRRICYTCQTVENKFERELKRREKEKTDPSSTPDKYLSKEGLTVKKDRYMKMAKKQKQRADRLKKRVDALEIKLDAALKDELSFLLNMHQHKMTPLQREFWKAQVLALKLDDKRGMRWHPMLIRLALHLHSLSPGAYEFLQDSKVLCLPSRRRLYDYSHFVDAKEGCQQELTELIRKKMKKAGAEEHFSYMNLMLDEMHIKAGLVLNSSGDLVGYTQLDGVDEEIRKLEDEIDNKTYKPKLAKKVLVYLVQGITNRNVKDVVAIYSTDDLSVSQLYDKTWEVIYHLEDADIKVLCVTCDGAAVNRKFIYMHEPFDGTSKYIFSTKNLAAGDGRPLFFIVDPPHLLKTIRNALANSFCHKKSRKLWKNGELMSWKVIEILYEITKGLKFPGHKLTKAHVKLSSFSCMTVLLATQLFSKSVGRCIRNLSTHPEMAKFQTTELIKFIFLMNRFFDCLNGMREKGEEESEHEEEFLQSQETPDFGNCEEEGDSEKDKAPYCDPEDKRFEFLLEKVLGYFEEWKNEILTRPGVHTKAELNAMIITHQALGALEITVRGIIGSIKFMLTKTGAPAVSARVFNQDPLEQYFSGVRRSGGDNRQPNLKRVLDTRLNLTAQGQLSMMSTKGNTQAG